MKRGYSPGYRPARDAAEAAERDARAQYWMNQRKIERVAEAAARSGWYEISYEEYEAYRLAGQLDIVTDELACYLPLEDGRYRVMGFVQRGDTSPDFGFISLRKVESFATAE